MAGRFDCGCRYQLRVIGFNKEYDRRMETDLRQGFTDTSSIIFDEAKQEIVEQWQGKAWKKVCSKTIVEIKLMFLFLGGSSC